MTLEGKLLRHLTAIVAFVLVVTLAAPVSAETPRERAEIIGEEVLNATVEATHVQDRIQNLRQPGIGIPNHSDQAIKLVANTGEVVTVGLPAERTKEGLLVGAGSQIFESASPDADIVVQSTSEGTRIVSVLRSSRANTKLKFELGIPQGASVEVESDDSVSINSRSGDLLASISPPWAVDADGNPVETAYKIQNNTLIQIVKPGKNTVFPIYADPILKNDWWGQTIKLSRSEMDNVRGAMGIGSGASALGAVACAGATGGLCAIPWTVGAALLAIGSGALLICGNSKGVDIHRSWTGAVWCSGY